MALTGLWLVLAAGAMAAPAMSDDDCLVCHADNTLTTTNAAGRAISLFVDQARLAASVHKTNSCVSCHTDITSTHPDDNRPVPPVNCALCHELQGDSYGASVHGLARKAGHETAATCRIATVRMTFFRRLRPLRRSTFPARPQRAATATRRRRGLASKRPWPGHGDWPSRRAHLHRLSFGT